MRLQAQTWVTILLMGCFGVSCMAQEKVQLLYKANAGQTARYRSDEVLTIDNPGAKAIIEGKEVSKVTFTDIAANGNITILHETESSQMRQNGQALPPTPNTDKDTIIFRPDGTVVSYKSTSSNADQVKLGARLYPATTPVFPATPVGVGSKWSKEFVADTAVGFHAGKADFELLSSEKVNGIDSFKIKMIYKETDSTPVLTATSTIWVEKSSGDAVQADSEIENVPWGPGGTAPYISAKEHQVRIEGGPLKGTVTNAGPEPPKKDKTIDEVVKDYEKVPGLFTLYRKKDNGNETIYMEIKEDQLDKLMMMEVTASTGTSQAIVAGDPINDMVFKWVRKADDKLMMVTPNIAYRADPKTPIARSLRRSFADAYIQQFHIDGKQVDRKSILINVSEMFRGDIAEVSSIFTSTGQPYGMDREKTAIASIKNFPENIAVETDYHFVRLGPPRNANDSLADSRSMPLKIMYNVFPLPDNGYKPRLADARIGYFQTDFQSYDNDSKQDQMVRYIHRWDLQKTDPKAAMSPPKKPIVFWLDNAIPLEYRDSVRDGLLYWNKAFEKIGIKDAIVIKQMPDNADWDHADMRYNTIRWVTSPAKGYAIAQARANPVTGQILNANITVDEGMAHFTRLEHKNFVDPVSFFDQPDPMARIAKASATHFSRDPAMFLQCDMAEEAKEQAWFGYEALSMLATAGVPFNEKTYTCDFIREVVSHEMGHIMGLRHNFIASTYHSLDDLKNENIIREQGITSSVMDYTPFNISALKLKGVDYWTPTIGPYDYWAIQYGYTAIDAQTTEGETFALKQIANRCNEPGHQYQSDEIADQFDPAVVRFDLGTDPLAYSKRELEVSRHLLLHLGARVPLRGESYFEFTRSFYGLLNMHFRAAARVGRYVGGLHSNRNFKGDRGEKPALAPVDAAQQRQALDMLNTYLFSENALTFPNSYYTKLTADPNIDFASAFTTTNQEAPIRDRLSSVQRAALLNIFNPNVLRRVSNNEFKIGDPAKAFTMATLFETVGSTVWSELGEGKNIGPLHRQLQRTHLDVMVAFVLSPPNGTPDDAKSLAWDQLRQLKGKISAVQNRKYDTYSRVHLQESLVRVNRALNAQSSIIN